MAVAFDAVGPGATSAQATGATTLSWTHTNVAGAVALTVTGVFGDTASAGKTFTAANLDPAGANTNIPTIGGPVDSGANAGGTAAGFVQMWGLANVSSGAHTVKLTASAVPDHCLLGGSVSYTGADLTSPFGTAQTTSDSVIRTSHTITHTGSVSGNIVTAGTCDGDNTLVISAGTGRHLNNFDNATRADNIAQGDIAGGGSVTLTWTSTNNDHDALIAVEVMVPSGAASPGPPFTAIPPGRIAPVTFRQPWPPPAQPPPPVYTIASASLGSSPATITVPVTTNAGDAIVVSVNSAGPCTGVTDSRGNTYRTVAAYDATNNVGVYAATFNARPGIPTLPLTAGVDTITLLGAFNAPAAAAIDGVRGVAPIPFDAQPAEAGATNATPSGPATDTLGQAGDIVIYSLFGTWGDTSTVTSMSFQRVTDANAPGTGITVGYLTAPDTTTVTPSATLVSSQFWRAYTLALTPSSVPVGAPLIPLSAPVNGGISRRALPPAGRIDMRAGVFTSGAVQAGPPVYPRGHPVQAKPYPPPQGGRIDMRGGTFAQLGPPVRPPDGPVRAPIPAPVRGGTIAHRVGTFAQQGPPVRQWDGPVKAQPQFPVLTGRADMRAGVFAQQGPPVRPPDGPVQAQGVRGLPARGRVSRNFGTFTALAPQAGPPVYPLGHPVTARRYPLPQGGTVAHRAGTYDQLGPPVRQWDGPIVAQRPLPPPGRVAHRAGTFTLVIPGAGPPIYPLGHPVTAKPYPPPRGGTVAHRAGIFAQLGPPVRPADGPVVARPPLPARGRVSRSYGTYTAVAPQAGPPVRQWDAPVRAQQYPPPQGGRVVRRAGVYAQAGPPVKPAQGPIGIYRRQPPPPARGRVTSLRGTFAQQGPPVRPLRHALRAQPQYPVLYGRSDARTGTWTAPPDVIPATGTPSVLDPRDGTASSIDPRDGTMSAAASPRASTSSAADLREGTPSVSDPREGTASVRKDGG